jgi:hypothetical protein
MNLIFNPGDQVKHLTIIERIPDRGGHPYYLCRCKCGKTKTVRISTVISGNVNGCNSCSKIKHGHNQVGQMSSEYKSWESAKQRVTNPNCEGYESYGGRGIAMCDRWLESFSEFLKDMGPKPSPHHTIERLDSDDGYYPGNCVWATLAEQNRNKKGVIRITHNGKTQCAAEWERELGFRDGAIREKLSKGLTFEQAIARPITNERKEG